MSSATNLIYNRAPAWLQNILVSTYGYKLYHKRYTGIFEEIRDLVRSSRSWSQQQKESWQAEQLHLMIKHCRESVPYYQRLFSEHGLHEQDFTHPQDIKKLPILTKAVLKQNIDLFRSSTGKTFLTQQTSGSTGTPLRLEVDEYTYKLAMALVVDHEETNGVPFGSRRATFAGRMIKPAENLTPPFSRFNKAENQKLFSSYHLNVKTFPYYADELNEFSPVELIGYPSAISDLANHYLSSGITPGFRLSAVVTNSETLLDWQRDVIESAFNCPVFDYYGTAEYVTFASQNADQIYQVSPLLGITEIAGPDDDLLLATSLTNRTMPLLRYELGDTAVAAGGSSTGPVYEIERIKGRIDDYVILPSGRKIGRLDHIFKGIQEITEAQIVQDAPDHCTINLVTNAPCLDPIADRITRAFEERTGDEMRATVKTMPGIPRGPNGKFKNVVQQFHPHGCVNSNASDRLNR